MILSSADPQRLPGDLAPGPFTGARRPVEPPLSLRGLPTRRRRLPSEILDSSHRNRIMMGAVAVLGEHGYAASTVVGVFDAAGVSRATFYRYFADKQACFLAAYDAIIGWLEREARAACADSAGWSDRVRAAAGSTLALLAANPAPARLVAAEILCLGSPGQDRQRALVDRLTPPLRLGREDPVSPDHSPRLEPALLSGAISMIGREVSSGRGDRLADLTPDLTEFLLTPYVGVEEARRIAVGDEGTPAALSALR